MHKIKLEYLVKYQSGGLTTFSPNPRNFNAPLQGINPGVLQYDIKTSPLDTTGLIQVMQTKDANDYKNKQLKLNEEELAIEREKLNFGREKLDAEMTAKWYDLVFDTFITKTKATKDVNGGLDPSLSIGSGSFMSGKLVNSQANINEQQEALSALLSGGKYDSKNIASMINIQKKIEREASTSALLPLVKLDDLMFSGLVKAIEENKSSVRVHPGAFLDYSNSRLQFSQEGKGDYQIGKTTFTGIYNPEVESNNYEEIIKRGTKSIETGEAYQDGNMIKENKKMAAPDNDLAAKNMAEAVMSSRGTLLYMDESKFNNELYHMQPEDQKKALVEHFKQQLEIDDAVIDAVNSSEFGTYKGQVTKDKEGKTSTVNINVNKPGTKIKDRDLMDILGDFISGTEKKDAVAQALITSGLDYTDPYYIKQAIAAFSDGKLEPEEVEAIKEKGKVAVVESAKSEIEKFDWSRALDTEDKGVLSTYLTNPELQDAYYREVYYPNEVKPYFDAVKSGKIKISPKLGELNDNQIKYIFHHHGPEGGSNFIQTGAHTNPKHDEKLKEALNLIGDGDYIDELRARESTDRYGIIHHQFSETKSTAFGAYGVLFKTHKESLRSFLMDNKDSFTTVETTEAETSYGVELKDGKTINIPKGIMLKSENREKPYELKIVTEKGKEYLQIPYNIDEPSQKILKDLGLLEETGSFSPSINEVNEVPELIKGETVLISRTDGQVLLIPFKKQTIKKEAPAPKTPTLKQSDIGNNNKVSTSVDTTGMSVDTTGMSVDTTGMSVLEKIAAKKGTYKR